MSGRSGLSLCEGRRAYEWNRETMYPWHRYYTVTVFRCARQPTGPILKQASTPQLTLKSFEMGVMFLPSLLGRPSHASDQSGDGDAESLAFTCTPGDAGLTQRFPLTLLHECEPGKALPLELLPLPYVLPGERSSLFPLF